MEQILTFKIGLKTINPKLEETDKNSLIVTIENESLEIPIETYRKIVSNPYAGTEVKFLELLKHYQSVEFEEIK
ncbi:hypothetical protein [Lutibacter sp.]|uniref:hypothetical protein n=1 Tax=Lutibacter sp. TaxID=1925666 RepID=UPI0034A06EB2